MLVPAPSTRGSPTCSHELVEGHGTSTEGCPCPPPLHGVLPHAAMNFLRATARARTGARARPLCTGFSHMQRSTFGAPRHGHGHVPAPAPSTRGSPTCSHSQNQRGAFQEKLTSLATSWIPVPNPKASRAPTSESASTHNLRAFEILELELEPKWL